MNILLRFLIFILLGGSSLAQSNLPLCPSSGYFDNCFGTRITKPSGDKYVGEFKNDMRNGRGTYTAGKGYKYEGEFKDNEFNGVGTETFADGSKWIGDWFNSIRWGNGTSYSSNGIVLQKGYWANGTYASWSAESPSVSNQVPASASMQANISKNNLPFCPEPGLGHQCWGTVTDANEIKYVGEFQNFKRSGIGIEYSKDGTVLRSGTWFMSKFVSHHPIETSSFPFTTEALYQNLVVNNQSAPFQEESISKLTAPVVTGQTENSERDRLSAEIQAERKKRQELEEQLAKKLKVLEAQLAASVKPTITQPIAQRRIAYALVIGNGAYPGAGRLENPVNDANAISQKLRSMGFTVSTVIDANRQSLVQSMAQFRRTAASADISLLYYAGHGVQIFGTNYILPTDVDQTDPAQATIQGVSLNSVVENFLPGKTKLVFLDACRDNALQRTSDRSVSKGLAPISAAEGTLISYATKDGQTAADGVGSKNSPFTQALLEHLNDPQDIAVVLRKVRERVMKITGGKQQPWEYGSLTGGELVLSAIKPK